MARYPTPKGHAARQLFRANDLQQVTHFGLRESHPELLHNRAKLGHEREHVVSRVPDIYDVQDIPDQPRGVALAPMRMTNAPLVDTPPGSLICLPRIGLGRIHDVHRDHD